MDKSSAKETAKTAPSSVSRKRFERLSKTPQGAQHNKTEAEAENADEAEPAEATATEVAAEDNEAAADRTLSISPTLSECRRSSRKKIIKFDVRDLLNKNRKTQKIHIEARIDSNAAPAVPESSSRPFAMLEGSAETATTKPANRRKTLTALEVFAKPKVSQSFIVAQVSTEESHQNQQVQADPPSNDTPSPAPRKRGRPRKTQPVLLHKDVAAVRSYSYSDSDTNSSSNSTNSTTNSSGSESKNKLKNKLRVSLKRMNMPTSRDSSDSGELPLPIRPVDVVSNSSSDNTTNDRSVLLTIDEKHLEPERVDTTDGDEANIETETITLLPADDDDSDSQIIFVEIQNEAGTDESTLTTSNETGTNFKLIFPKEKEKKLLNKEQSEQTLERELIVEVARETSNLWSADDEEEKTSSPKSFEKRRSKRSTLRGSTLSSNNSSKMTLEETFAEIAAKSSESILKEESTEGSQDLEVEALIDLVEDSNSNSQIEADAHLASQLDLESQLQVPANVHQSDVPCVVQLDEKLPVETTSGVDNNKVPKAKQELKEQLRKQEAVDETLPTEEVQREVLEMEDLHKEKLQKEKLQKVEQPKKVLQKKKLQKGKLQNIEPENEEQQRELLIKETVQDALPRKELTNEMQNKGELRKENLQTEEVHKKMLLKLKPLKETRLKEKQEKKEVLKEDLKIKEPKMEDIRKDELQKEELNKKKVKEDELQASSDKVAMLHNCPKTPENISTSASEERTPQTTKSQAEPEAEADRKLEMTNKAGTIAEKQSTSRSPTLTPPPPSTSSFSSNKTKSEKASNVSIVECDAMFKEIDKVSTQAKKKSKAITKKQLTCKAQQEPEQPNEPPNSQKLSLIKNQLAPAEEQKSEETGKQRSSQHTPEAKVKGKQKKVQRKSENMKQISRQNSLDSSSSALQSASKRSSAKTSDALQLALTETESSESTGSSGNKIPTCGIPTPTAELEAQDPLNDIAKFIEAGVQLLKRDYKLEEQQQQQEQQTLQQTPEDEFAQQVANIETPATTPATTPSTSPQPSSNGADDTSSSTASGGVRRSHRIKQKPQVPKTNRTSSASQTSSMISMEDQLAELAHIDAINEQFLRQEGLNTFQPLRDNYYRCARQVSQENAEMQCDCFLTGDEEAMGHQCCGAGCINRMLMIECGPLCTSGDRCTNKRFQQHQCWPCRVFRTEKKGCGITAELQIPPGEFIMEYVGEVIDSEEFERRQHLYSRDRNRHYYFMALRGEAIIDATAKGNISRYINHSCDPNAETQKWTVNGELRIGFFSVKTILPGEEITFDYQYQRYGRDAQRCFCEAVNCRGWIGGEPDSDEGEQLNDESGEGESESEVDEELEQEADKLGRLSGKVGKVSSSKQAKQSSSSSTSSKQSKQAIRKQRKEQPKAKDREYKAGRWLRPSGSEGAAAGSGGEKSSSRKPNQLEDPDVLEQLTILNRSGLKNQADTLRFSRCMVRAKLLQTRLQLLGVLTRGELPCRRLFLDYHGVRLLHAWFSESESNNQLRLALLEALESLPIPNRTMLNDSRVYQSVQAWSESAVEAGAEEQVRQRILALLQKWNALPEIFRIPKRERIEQMKEHEREADRQQQPHHGATALEDSNSNSASATLNSDRYRQDRFRRDTSSRYEKPKLPARMSGNNTICTITNTQLKERNGNGGVESVSLGTPGGGGVAGSASNGNSCGMSKADPRRRSELTNDRRTISKELRRSLFARKVAQDEAEKRVSSEDWREHEVRCEYFGAELSSDPSKLPFYQNTETNEWFNSSDHPVPAPLHYGHGGSHSPECTDVEYKLPAGVEPLPTAWHWNVTVDGSLYYYNLRDRIPQWEPPSAQQRMQELVEDSPPPETPVSDSDLLVNIDAEYVSSLSEKSLVQYIEAKVRERREIRRSVLVSVRTISPRRDEDRINNQLEARKYKENKEKIRRRKELYRRKRIEASNSSSEAEKDRTTSETDADNVDTLPIQSYLYSSDEDGELDASSSASTLPLLDAIVDKATRVDELDMARIWSSSSKSEINITESLPGVKRKLPMPPQHIPEAIQKKHRSERDRKRKSLLSTSSGRESYDKFRSEISGHVAEYLRPYCKDTCKLGRITSDVDFKFLIKRLSDHITTKELRCCEATGIPMACTESVKHKSYDFVNQYMRQKGPVYKKPANEPDY